MVRAQAVTHLAETFGRGGVVPSLGGPACTPEDCKGSRCRGAGSEFTVKTLSQGQRRLKLVTNLDS